MSKFTGAIETLRCAEEVTDHLEYKMQDELSMSKYYEDKIAEREAAGEEIDKDDYQLRYIREYHRKAELYKELVEFLEKKYLK